jgi:kanamycin kinase
LKTNAYKERFFDAYGREKIEEERLLAVAAAEVFG